MGSRPICPLFLRALSFECTRILQVNFINQYFKNNIETANETIESLNCVVIQIILKLITAIDFWISAESMSYYLLLRKYCYFNKLKYHSQNTLYRRSGELASYIYLTYNDDAMLHGRHIYKTAAAMTIATLYDFPSDQHALLHWKCVLC